MAEFGRAIFHIIHHHHQKIGKFEEWAREKRKQRFRIREYVLRLLFVILCHGANAIWRSELGQKSI